MCAEETVEIKIRVPKSVADRLPRLYEENKTLWTAPGVVPVGSANDSFDQFLSHLFLDPGYDQALECIQGHLDNLQAPADDDDGEDDDEDEDDDDGPGWSFSEEPLRQG